LLTRRVEAAILDHANPRVLAGHVRAAAFEGPITSGDAVALGEAAVEQADRLAERGELRRTPAGLAWAGRDYPAARTGLRSADAAAVTVVEVSTGAVLGLVDAGRAPSTVHEGAIYLHLGDAYRVLSSDGGVALVEPFSGAYYTQTKRETETAITGRLRHERRLGTGLSFGRVEVTEQVIAYQKRTIQDGTAFETVPLSSPPQTFETEAIWFSPEPTHLVGCDGIVPLLGTLHAAEHAMIALLPLFAMCDRWDIGGLSTNRHPQTGLPTIFVYDGHAGGVGIAERGFACFEAWVADTARLLRGCACDRGCPSCVQSPKCGNLNEPLDKDGALRLLERLLVPDEGLERAGDGLGR
jgi:DEAD/DEAH box helicase domain-containing protein